MEIVLPSTDSTEVSWWVREETSTAGTVGVATVGDGAAGTLMVQPLAAETRRKKHAWGLLNSIYLEWPASAHEAFLQVLGSRI